MDQLLPLGGQVVPGSLNLLLERRNLVRRISIDLEDLSFQGLDGDFLVNSRSAVREQSRGRQEDCRKTQGAQITPLTMLAKSGRLSNRQAVRPEQ